MNRRSFLALPAAALAAPPLARELDKEFERVDAVDTHEHIIPEQQRVKEPADFFLLASHYAVNDVISAGMPAETKSWEEFEPYWRHARYTGYGQCLRIAIREVYGFDEISARTLPKINAAIADANKPGLYRRILKQRAKLRFALNDEYWHAAPHEVEPEFFRLAKKFDWFITPITRAGVGRLENLAGRSITRLRDLKEGLEHNFAENMKLGLATVKTTLAYDRELLFHEVSPADAERDFERLMRDESPAPEGFRRYTNRPYRQLADHMFHHLVRLAEAHNLPFQIHTGLHAGNGNWLTNSRPSLLQNLFFLYPRVKFDLFHTGYPYQGETAVLAKLFPNVYVDFCWMHVVSPSDARSALDSMLDTVPVNKIFGFGGDYRYPELSYAHLIMARRNIAEVLAARVQRGLMTQSEAVEVGRLLLADNADAVFGPQAAKRKA